MSKTQENAISSIILGSVIAVIILETHRHICPEPESRPGEIRYVEPYQTMLLPERIIIGTVIGGFLGFVSYLAFKSS